LTLFGCSCLLQFTGGAVDLNRCFGHDARQLILLKIGVLALA